MSQPDPLDLREQQDQQASAVRRAQLAAERDVEDFKWLLGDKRGRRLVWRLLEQSGVFRSSYDNSSLRMAMQEGQRNYGLFWMNEVMAHAPEAFVQMLNEREENKT